MRTLAVQTFLTLDGVMQAPGGPEEDPTGGFAHGGWSVSYWDESMGEVMGAALARPFDLLLGRKTYEIFAAHWPHVTAEEREARGGVEPDLDEEAGAAALNNARKYVASRTLTSVAWNNSVLLEGDVATAVADLKSQEGPEIQVHGSANLIQTLIGADLVDEFRLWVFPLVLGSGKRLFDEGTIPSGLELVSSTTSSTGVVMATYRRAGDISYASFAFEDPTDAETQRREHLT